MNGYDPQAMQAQNAAMAQQQALVGQGLTPQQVAMMQNNAGGMPLHMQQQGEWMQNNAGGMPLHMQQQGEWMRANGAGNDMPTGGIVGRQTQHYRLANGRYRKPDHASIIQEIHFYTGVNPNGSKTTRVEDCEEFARHACMLAPHIFRLERNNYEVIMPDFVANVQFYVHQECGTILIYKDSLP